MSLPAAARAGPVNHGVPSTSSGAEQERTLWMGDMETYMDADFLAEAFHRMGEEIVGMKLVHDKYSGRPAGYCFVEMADADSARRAMLNVNGKVIPRSRPPVVFNLSFSANASSPYTEYNVLVMNLPPEIDDSGLFMLFGERYRSCKGAKVARHVDGASKCTGTVRFTDAHDQHAAVRDMGQVSVLGRHLVLRVAAPRYRGPRQAFFASAAYDPSQYYVQHQDYYSSGQWEVHDQRSQMQLLQREMAKTQTHAAEYEARRAQEMHDEWQAQTGGPPVDVPMPLTEVRSMPSALAQSQGANVGGDKKSPAGEKKVDRRSFFDTRLAPPLRHHTRGAPVGGPEPNALEPHADGRPEHERNWEFMDGSEELYAAMADSTLCPYGNGAGLSARQFF